ncbi:MAG: GAF domain-containing protein [Symploca sp. SIO1A3]|nr:GAF domain-containing protein [Symploca sp. SIO1A3]
MQELEQSKQKLDKSLSKSNGNLTPTQLKNGSDINFEQHFRDERQWLFNLVSQLLQAQNTQTLLTTTVNEVRQHFQVERVLIYRCQTENRGMVEAESMKAGYTPSLGESLLINTFGAEHRLDYRQQQVIALNDVSETSVSPYQWQLLEKFQVKASLSLPILLEGQLWGLLVLQQCSGSRQWQEAEIMLLCQLVTELRLYLQPLEFRYQRLKQAQQDSILEQILGRVAASGDTYAALGNIVQELRQFYGVDRVVVYRFNADWSGDFVAESVGRGWVAMLEAQQKDASLRAKEITASDYCVVKRFGFPASSSTTDTFLKETQGNGYFIGERIKRVDDIYNAGFSDCYISTLKKYQARAYLIAPIFEGEGLWGLLAVYQNSGPRHWQDEEVTLLSLLSERLGSILKELKFAAQLREQSQQLAKAARREQAVANLLDQIRRTLDINTIFRTTTKEVLLLLNADRVVLYRFNPDWSGEFVSESVGAGWVSLIQQQRIDSSLRGNDLLKDERCSCKELREPFFPATDTYLQSTQGGSFVRGEQYRQVDDIYAANFAPCYLETLEKYQAKAYVIMPVFQGKSLWGLLAVYQNSGVRAWEETEVRFLAQITGQLAVALRQRNCLEQLQGQSAQIAKAPLGEQAAAKLLGKLCQGGDVENFLENLTREVRLQMGCDRVAIYRFNPDWSGEYVTESLAKEGVPLVGATIEPDHLQATEGGRYRFNQIFAVDDVHGTLCPVVAEYWEKFQVKAYLTVPIFQGEKLWGLLSAYQHATARDWQGEEVGLLTHISRQFWEAQQQTEYLGQLEWERAKGKLIEKISNNADIDSIFRTATKEVRRQLGCDRVVVYRFNPDWSGSFVAESVTTGWMPLVGPNTKKTWPFDTHLEENQGNYYRRNEPLMVEDIQQVGFSSCYLDLLEEIEARAYLIMPVFAGEKLWGLMAAYQNSGPRHWQTADVDCLSQIVKQLAVAVRQADSMEQATKAAQRQQAVASVIDKIRETSDTDTIFQTVTKEVRQLLECDRLAVYRFDADWSGKFVAESVAKGWVKLVGPGIETIWPDSFLQETKGGRYRQHESFVVNDIDETTHAPCHRKILEQFEVKAYVIVPVFAGDTLWGLLGAYQNSGSRYWQPEEVNLLAQIGKQFGVAVKQAEYIEELRVQSQKLTTSVKRGTVYSQLIYRLGLVLIQEDFSLDHLWQLALLELRRQLKCDRVALYRFSADWGGEFVVENVGSDWLKVVGTDLAYDEDPYLQETRGGRYRSKETLSVDNIDKVERDSEGLDKYHIRQLKRWGTKAYMVAPIFKGEQLWGLLGAYQHDAPREWEQIDLNLLVQVGVQVGLALQQAEYLEQLREQTEQLTLAAGRERTAKEQLQQDVIRLLSAVRPALNGDLTVRATVTENEVGTIADAYNNTLQSLRGLVKQVQTASRQVAETSQGSESAISGLTEQAQQQFQALGQALAQIQMMVNATEAVEMSAQQVEIAAQQANHTVQEGDAAMNRTVEGIMDIRETVAETSKRIKRLSESSQKVSRVVSLISNFTTQTQLLALNAAIEATRAGEYGRGFVVVADEVRSLARQSAEATSEIEQLVQEIQQGTAEVSTVMETGIQQVAQGTAMVQDARQNLSAIVEATSQISNLVEGITESTQVQAQEFQSMTKTMTDVAAIANQTSEDSIRISLSFQDLLMMAQNLLDSTDQFKVD